ncbi:MAG: PHB depolymerase family esterase, partial [bacterium]
MRGFGPGRFGAILLALCVLFTAVNAEARFIERNYKNRTYLKFVPDSLDNTDSHPLVVMLHGCTQTPRSFARTTNMNQVATRRQFIVIYPKQTREANRKRCWNWFKLRHVTRHKGEAALIAGMTRRTVREHNLDPGRVYLAGLSAGGAMAANLIIAYPDLYTAVGIHSGLEYRAATNPYDALSAMKAGGPEPAKQGRKAFTAMGDRARPIPTIVVHGEDDQTVAPVNGRQATRQAVATNRAVLQNQDSETHPDVTVHRRP